MGWLWTFGCVSKGAWVSVMVVRSDCDVEGSYWVGIVRVDVWKWRMKCDGGGELISAFGDGFHFRGLGRLVMGVGNERGGAVVTLWPREGVVVFGSVVNSVDEERTGHETVGIIDNGEDLKSARRHHLPLEDSIGNTHLASLMGFFLFSRCSSKYCSHSSLILDATGDPPCRNNFVVAKETKSHCQSRTCLPPLGLRLPKTKLGLWASVETRLMGQAKLGLWARRNWAYGPGKTGLRGQHGNWAYGPAKLGLWANMEIGLMGQCRNWAYGLKLGLWARRNWAYGPGETGLMGQAKLGLGANMEIGLMGQCRNWAYGSGEAGLMGQHGNWAYGPTWKLGLGARRNWAYGPTWKLGLWANCRNWAYGPGETGLMGQCGNWAWWASVETGLMGQAKLGLWANMEIGLRGQAKLGLWANMEIGLMGQCGNWAWWASVETGLMGQAKLGLWANVEIGLGGPVMDLERMRAVQNGLESRDMHVGTVILKGDVICECRDKTRYAKNFAPGENSREIRKAAPVSRLCVDEFQGGDA
ncbi:hypothetical protein V8G54_017624 [Vigna mungo]|uniref:Uncharacterized protein n=1 Tax=Vigna mungo TaxID=3915 RepID=A0AAQ3NMH6_VIGMU